MTGPVRLFNLAVQCAPQKLQLLNKSTSSLLVSNHQGCNFVLKSGYQYRRIMRRPWVPRREERRIGRKYISPHPTLGLRERSELFQRGPARPKSGISLRRSPLLTARDSIFSLSPFCPEKWGYGTVQFKKWGTGTPRIPVNYACDHHNRRITIFYLNLRHDEVVPVRKNTSNAVF